MRIITEDHGREFLVDGGRGFRTVRWLAWRQGRPRVRGYGLTEEEAIYDLVHNVQPLSAEEEAELERGK